MSNTTNTAPATPETSTTPVTGEAPKQSTPGAHGKDKKKRAHKPFDASVLPLDVFGEETIEGDGENAKIKPGLSPFVARVVECVEGFYAEHAMGLNEETIATDLLGDERHKPILRVIALLGFVQRVRIGREGVLYFPSTVIVKDGKIAITIRPTDEQIGAVRAACTHAFKKGLRQTSLDAIVGRLDTLDEDAGWSKALVEACLSRLADFTVNKSGMVSRSTDEQKTAKLAAIVALDALASEDSDDGSDDGEDSDDDA